MRIRGGAGRERDGNIASLFYLFMRSLIASRICPDQGSKPQPWHIGMMLQWTELAGQTAYGDTDCSLVWPTGGTGRMYPSRVEHQLDLWIG